MEVPDLNNLATSPVIKLLVSVPEYSTSVHNYNSYNTGTSFIHSVKDCLCNCIEIYGTKVIYEIKMILLILVDNET